MVAHATVLRLTTSPAVSHLSGAGVPIGDLKVSGERLRARDLGAHNDDDKRGVSNPRAGSGTEFGKNRGGCSRPGSTVDGD